MQYSYDLHIHSALSPCSTLEMTPNNIINMAHIKKLNIISITDHNCMDNVKPIMKLGIKKDILVVPGIEVTTKEDVHVLCYFKDLINGLNFSKEIYESLPDIKNNEIIFGEQILYDEYDSIIGSLDKLLLNSSTYTIGEINELVNYYNGAMVPAHIDRKSYGLLGVLGFIPKGLNISSVEVSSTVQLGKSKLGLEYLNVIYNSDAHDLGSINEPIYFINLKEFTLENVIGYLKGENP